MNLQSEAAYDFIERKIISREYGPGYFISTKKLAGEIGISRTPIRDALRTLELKGLVTMTPRFGAQVRALSSQQFQEMWQIRSALEGLAAQLAAENRTEEDIALLRVNLDATRNVAELLEQNLKDNLQHEEFVKRDQTFHSLVIAASGNTLLKEEVQRLELIKSTCAPIGVELRDRVRRPLDTLKHHTAIFEAIKKRDSTLARELIEEHLSPKTHSSAIKSLLG